MMVAFLSEDSGAHRALPPQLHQHLVLRGAREKPIANDDALPLSRPGSTASNEACSDSLASGTSETDSTQPTTFSMLRAGPSVSTCLNENDPGSSRSQNLDDEGGVLKPSIPGLINRVRAPKSRRRYGTVIVDPRKDNSYRVPSSQSVNTSDSGSSNRRPTTAYQGSRWPGNSHPGHPIPYMGAFSRVSSYKTAQESSSAPSIFDASTPAEKQAKEQEEPPRCLQGKYSSTSSGRRWCLDKKRRVEEWADTLSGFGKRLLHSDEGEILAELDSSAKSESESDELGPKVEEGLTAGGTSICPPPVICDGAAEATSPHQTRALFETCTISGEPHDQGNASQEETAAKSNSTSQNRSSKRRAVGGHRSSLNRIPEDDKDEKGEDDKKAPQPNPGKGKWKQPDVLFACPYFKHDPAKYVGREWRSCCGPGWELVRRVKDHLYSHHQQPKDRCGRCGGCFEDKLALDAHFARDEACKVRRPLPQMDGFDEKQEAQLKSRKRSVAPLSEVEKWRQVYSILFPQVPQEDVPSPFYEYAEVQPQPPAASESIRDFQEYALQRIDGDLRPTLEEGLETHLGIANAADKNRAVEWVKEIHRRLLEDFTRDRFRRAAVGGPPTTQQPLAADAPVIVVTPANSSGTSSRQQLETPPPNLASNQWSVEEERLFAISPDTVCVDADAGASSLTATTEVRGENIWSEEQVLTNVDEFDFHQYLDEYDSSMIALEMVRSPPPLLPAADSAYGSASTANESSSWQCLPDSGEVISPGGMETVISTGTLCSWS